MRMGVQEELEFAWNNQSCDEKKKRIYLFYHISVSLNNLWKYFHALFLLGDCANSKYTSAKGERWVDEFGWGTGG